MIHFIGVGAQKSGTSWAYTCLYDHPEVCAPIKEIHFFSRPRFREGKEWYESHFASCKEGKICGEFSTSYLYAKDAAERIYTYYPQTKIIAILRNPIDRGYSQYRNTIKSGEIPETMSYDVFVQKEESVRAQGLYHEQLMRYAALYPREQLLVLIYEDIRKDPVMFMKRIYAFLGIDDTFISSMVHDEINVARTPKHVFVDRVMHHISETMRSIGLDRVVHLIRRSGLPDLVRSANTKSETQSAHTKTFDREKERAFYKDDVEKLSTFIERDMMTEWGI